MELEERLKEYQNQVKSLTQERANLLREIELKSVPQVSTTDHESQTDDRQHEKMVQINNKLKRALQSVKDKINRAVTERPHLFDGIGEETSERLDHLIATVEQQAAQIDVVQAEYNQSNDRCQRQIQELQGYIKMDGGIQNFLSLSLVLVP